MAGDGFVLVATSLDELLEHRHPDNPKTHDVDELLASMRRFGFVAPVTVCERTGLLAAGHGRLEALQRLRAEGQPAPAGVTVTKAGEWQVPTIRGWASKDDAELRAWLIADNRHPERGGWDFSRLTALLQDLSEGPGLDGVGFTDDQLADMMLTLGAAPSLEDLSAGLGEGGERDLWPELHFRVHPAVRDRYEAAVAAAGVSEDPAARFAWLVEQAEGAHAAT